MRMRKKVVLFIVFAFIMCIQTSAISIAASQALEYIRNEYYYDISEADMEQMESICENHVNEDAIERIVSKLDKYSCYYTAEYCRNLRPEKSVHDIETAITCEGVYIKINTFAQDTGKVFIKVWESVKETDTVFIDLRNCEGGYITAMLEVASCLLKEGVVCTAEYKNETQTYEVKESFAKIPPEKLYILVSEKTASSAEILSGAVKSRGAGTVIGDSNTFGKTSIQKLVQLKSGGIMKFTVGKYRIWNSDDITEKGVEPDMVMIKPIG